MKKARIVVDLFRRILPIVLLVMALSALSVSVSAKSDSSDSMSATIMLTTATKVGNTPLASGEYKVIADGSHAKFQKGGKVVADVPCTLKALSFMPKATSFVLEHDSISEIQVTGNIKAIEFSSGPTGGD